MVDIIIAFATLGALAILILIVGIFFRTKYGKNVCKKHFRKGNSYLKLHGSIFWLLQYQIYFFYTNQLLKKNSWAIAYLHKQDF